jgi:hypothetical protein
MAVFWVDASCSLVVYRGDQKISLIVLMMKTATTTQMLVKVYRTTRRYNPEDSHLHSCRGEILKSC